jgi:hypothetical protein
MECEQVRQKGTERIPKSFVSNANSGWWLFCLAIVVLKFSLLAIDPLPKLFMGDSRTYLWTALSGWIPEDRSYFYGYVIRWLSQWTQSLTSLLIVQVFLSALIAIIVAWICGAVFGLANRFAYLFGFLCSIDPLQLEWERSVMTETFSLFFYTLVLQQSFVYLRDRRITTLLIIQILSVITIGFRMSFFIVIQVMVVALPLIAFLMGTRSTTTAVGSRLKFLKCAVFWRHLAASVVTMFLLDQGYQYAYGFLSHREPARLHGTGYILLSVWAPALQPQDATDPRLAEIIQHGSEFGLGDISFRMAQKFTPGFLVDRWCRTETDPRKSSKIARETALRAFRRSPAEVIMLAAKTYFASWRSMRDYAKSDILWRSPEDRRPIAEDLNKTFGERFHLLITLADLPSKPNTFIKRYYVAAWPYYLVLLLSPLLSFVLLFIARNKAHALLLFVHTAVLLAGTFLLCFLPVVRLLQPLSLLTLVSLALALKSVLDWRSAAPIDGTLVC